MSILIVLAAALLGCIAGSLATRRAVPGVRRQSIALLAGTAALAAAGAHAVLFLLNLGLPFEVVDAIEGASYFVFGFSITAAWRLAKPPVRWLLLALIPIALYEPLRLAAVIAWLALKRFGA